MTLTALADFLQLKRATVRRMGLRPARRGARGREARFLPEEVAAELGRRNPRLADLWPAQEARFLTPPAAAEVLTELMPRVVTVQSLAKWRHERRGPLYVRITRKAIRYRREDLDGWVKSVAPE